MTELGLNLGVMSDTRVMPMRVRSWKERGDRDDCGLVSWCTATTTVHLHAVLRRLWCAVGQAKEDMVAKQQEKVDFQLSRLRPKIQEVRTSALQVDPGWRNG